MSRWTLTYDGHDPASEGTREALCTLGNGYFATRGADPEASADGVHYPGTYLAGCYDRLTSRVAGRDVDNEDLVNAPNWLPLRFRIGDGPWLDAGALVSCRRELDLQRGVLTRMARFADPDGRTVAITQRRLVSMDDPHVAALETTFTAENWSGPLLVRSALDATVANTGVARYRDLDGGHLVPGTSGEDGADAVWLWCSTASSRVGIALAAATRVRDGEPKSRTTRAEPAWIGQDLLLEAAEGVPVTVEKIVTLFTSRDRAVEEPVAAARSRLRRTAGFDGLLERHVLVWSRLWRRCQLSVDREDVQRVLNLHMFHLLQTVSEHTVDLDVGVPARGLHGEAYRGHVFWDELFVLPFLSLRFPEIARALLMYRWRRLPEARWAAHAAGRRGAMFPWQSGADGREDAQRLHLNPRSGHWTEDRTHLQRHVGLAVAYNVWRYYEASGDEDFLAGYGAELILEVARFFTGLADYDRATDRYRIRGVMGPDEYHDRRLGRPEPGLDDNAYTNVLTAWVLCRALETLAVLPRTRAEELRDRLGLDGEELARMEDVSRRLRVPVHDGVISQFDGYGELEELDWAAYRERYGDIRRLDRILEAEGDTVNRYKASKQADVLMLAYLLSASELRNVLARLGLSGDPDLFPRTIAYYLPRTCNGSTLSSLVHAWLLARTDGEAAWGTFLETLRGDLDDLQHGTTAEGVHLGAMAGSVDLVQRCYAGVSTHGGTLRLEPRLPSGITELRLGLRYRGHWGADLTVRRDRLRVALRPGAASPVEVVYQGRSVIVEAGGSWSTSLVDGRPPPTG